MHRNCWRDYESVAHCDEEPRFCIASRVSKGVFVSNAGIRQTFRLSINPPGSASLGRRSCRDRQGAVAWRKLHLS